MGSAGVGKTVSMTEYTMIPSPPTGCACCTSPPTTPARRVYAKAHNIHPVVLSYLDNHQEHFHVCRRDDSGTARVTALRPDQLDLDQVIAQARSCRGERFSETDLEKLALWVIQRQKDGPLTTQDLISTPLPEPDLPP